MKLLILNPNARTFEEAIQTGDGIEITESPTHLITVHPVPVEKAILPCLMPKPRP